MRLNHLNSTNTEWFKRLSALLVSAAVGAFFLTASKAEAVNLHMWLSMDDVSDVYLGSSSSTTSYITSTTVWTTPTFFSTTLSIGDYIYIAAADVFAVAWGLGGYTSVDGGSTFTAISASSFTNWDVAYIDSNGFSGLPTQTTVDSWITMANSMSLWQTPVAGTAFPGFGMPAFYGSLPAATTSVWADLPSGFQQPYMRVLFRYYVVPEPASMVALASGVVGLAAIKRRRKNCGE